jgi:N-acetylneuraminic acid mutarotase
MIIWGGTGSNPLASNNIGWAYDPATDTWTALSNTGGPAPRLNQVAVWTGTEMVLWGGYEVTNPLIYLNTGAAFNPDTGTWRPLSSKASPDPLTAESVVWTGSEMILWGGQVNYGGQNYYTSNSGARYQPALDQWRLIVGSIGRTGHTAVWTGTEVIIWGGTTGFPFQPSSGLRSGARFNPSTRQWQAISTDNAPSPRQNHQAVWTGTEMVVWGGEGYSTNGQFGQMVYGTLNSGAVYNPATDTWTPMEMDVVPTDRSGHSLVWTGRDVLMFGGRSAFDSGSLYNYLDNGGSYHPEVDSWSAINHALAPSARAFHSALWTGKEMLIWGGVTSTNNRTPVWLSNGGRYDPTLAQWAPLPTNGAPRTARLSAAVWMGDAALVISGNGRTDPGARFKPAANQWAPVSSNGAPSVALSTSNPPTSPATLVWTGKEALMWGTMLPSSGVRYDPSTDSWTPMTTSGAPRPRSGHTAVWTGDSMVIVGGSESSGTLPDATLIYQLKRPLYLYGKR